MTTMTIQEQDKFAALLQEEGYVWCPINRYYRLTDAEPCYVSETLSQCPETRLWAWDNYTTTRWFETAYDAMCYRSQENAHYWAMKQDY